LVRILKDLSASIEGGRPRSREEIFDTWLTLNYPSSRYLKGKGLRPPDLHLFWTSSPELVEIPV